MSDAKEGEELFLAYLCSWCCRLKIVQVGNHHPWCACGSDQFYWTSNPKKLTRKCVCHSYFSNF